MILSKNGDLYKSPFLVLLCWLLVVDGLFTPL